MEPAAYNPLTLVSSVLKQYIKKYEIDFCVANGENVNEGKSITEEETKELFDLGVHVITSGNLGKNHSNPGSCMSSHHRECQMPLLKVMP